MKVDVNVLLTTLTGGCPVVTKNDRGELEKLYKENANLNANLPLYEEKGLSKDELRAKNVEVKSAEIYSQVPALEKMSGSIAVAGQILYDLIESGESGSEEYLEICKMLRNRAAKLVGKEKVVLKFQNEVEQ